MADTSGARAAGAALVFDADVWEQEVGRFEAGSRTRAVAERARRELERSGVGGRHFQRCAAEGDDGTRLGTCLKLCAPLDRPSSEAPYGFVFQLGVDDGPPRRVELSLLAFGERHPKPGTRSVYERAHKRLYRRYPDE